jgi:cytochrome P450
MDSPAGNAPFVIDPTGRDIFGDAERIRALGPVACVEMPGGVRAWAVSDQGLLRRLLADPRISRDAYQHWPAWIDGEIPADWPLFAWVAVRNMLNAYGGDHRRLRGLAAGAFTASPRCGRGSRRSPPACWTGWPTCPRTGRRTCGSTTHTGCRSR